MTIDEKNQTVGTRQRDAGWSLVELIVVMMIVVILMAISLYSVRNARASGRYIGAVAVAHSYADAADRFAREHDGRYPAGPGQSSRAGVDWETGAAAQRGPKSDVLGQRKFYLRDIPEAVQDGTVTIGSTSPARIDYEMTGNGTGFRITLTVDGRDPCTISGGATIDTDNHCSAR